MLIAEFPAMSLKPQASPAPFLRTSGILANVGSWLEEYLFPPRIQPVFQPSPRSGRVWLRIPGGAASAPRQGG